MILIIQIEISVSNKLAQNYFKIMILIKCDLYFFASFPLKIDTLDASETRMNFCHKMHADVYELDDT